MSRRSRAAIGIWRSRAIRAPGERAYLVYVSLMVGLVAVVPLVRAVWMSATSAAGMAVFASPAAPTVTALAVAALWAGALLLGRERGPALRPPFLTQALATSDLSRRDAFGGPLLRSAALVTAVTAMAAALVAGSLLAHGLTGPISAVLFLIVGVLVGIVTAVAWLAGEALPRAAVHIALGVLALGALAAAFPATRPFVPSGLVALAYPDGGSGHLVLALGAFAATLVALVPFLLNRLALGELSGQAARWQSATSAAAGMDLDAAATIYRVRPRHGRHLRAVRPTRPLSWTFLMRDAIGAARTPGRLLVGLVTLSAAGVLLTLAFAPAAPGWLLGAAAGLLAYAGLGPLTDGIRHAASVASDLPLYGIGDGQLLAQHALLPLIVSTAVLLTAVAVCSILVGTGAATGATASVALGVLAVAARIDAALKRALPPLLLTPIPTAMGDLAAAARVGYALDGILLAAFAGMSAALAFESPVLLAGATAALVGIGVHRWRHRG